MPIGDTDAANIASGFQTRGERVVFNKNSEKFEKVSTEKAKSLSANGQYVTNLSGLKEQLAKAELSPAQRTQIYNAIRSRADDVTSRLGLFATLFGAKTAILAAMRSLYDLAGSVTSIALTALGKQAVSSGERTSFLSTPPSERGSPQPSSDSPRQPQAAPAVFTPPPPMMTGVGVPPPPPPPPMPGLMGPPKTPFEKALTDLGGSLGEAQAAAILKKGRGTADAGTFYAAPDKKEQLRSFIDSLERIVVEQDGNCTEATKAFQEARELIVAGTEVIETVALQYNLRVEAHEAQKEKTTLTIPCLTEKGISVATTFFPDEKPVKIGPVGDEEEVVGPISLLCKSLDTRMTEDLQHALDVIKRAKGNLQTANAKCAQFKSTPEGAALVNKLAQLATTLSSARKNLQLLEQAITQNARNDDARQHAFQNIAACKTLLASIEADMKAFRELVAKKQAALRTARNLTKESTPKVTAAPASKAASAPQQGFARLGDATGAGVRRKPMEFILRNAVKLRRIK